MLPESDIVGERKLEGELVKTQSDQTACNNRQKAIEDVQFLVCVT